MAGARSWARGARAPRALSCQRSDDAGAERRPHDRSHCRRIATRAAAGWSFALAVAVLLGTAGVVTSVRGAEPRPDENAVSAVIDDWHAAAAAADEDRYFGHMTEDAVFLGTDATERWTKAQFRAYAHPHFAKGKAWSFRAVRRAVSFSADGSVAWFDEDLATPNLGPCRGSGVLVRDGKVWKIAQYNLSVPIPNAVFPRVKEIIAGSETSKP